MSDESTFFVSIPGPPQAWQRPRFSGRSRGVYSPPALERWYDLAAAAIWPLWSLTAPLAVPLRVEVDAVTARPKSLPACLKRLGWTAARWRETTRRIKRPSVPDADNYGKAALDALQGGGKRPAVIHDDALVVEVTTRKWYAAQGEGPCVEIEVWEVEL